MAESKRFLERLGRGVVIGDGAMGTMLYQMGAFLNTCFDELNLTNPKLVGQVHREYVEAGVDFIETNTFGANEFKLGKFGLADKVEEINRAAVAIARGAGGADMMIAGAMGPLGHELPPYGTLTPSQAQQAFGRQAKALLEAGVDFLILETFSNPEQLLIAIEAVRAIADVPMVAQLSTNEYQETIYGLKLEQAIGQIAAHPSVTAVGLNCSIGPALMLGSLEAIRGVTDKPISVQPNAGMPREVEGRKIYMCTPEYMAEYGKRFFEKGARIIGGCCGTTPEHMKQIVQAVRPLDKAAAKKTAVHITVRVPTEKQELAAVPLAAKSALGRKIAGGQKVTTIEITPPRGTDLAGITEKAKLCAGLGVDAINIPDGPRASSRISPMITAIQIQQQAGIEAILHVCCRDRNIIGLQSDLLGACAIGLRNVLLITGDPPKLGEYPDATAVFDLDAIALTSAVRNLNRGVDIGGNTLSEPVPLTMGVGANPVAADLGREIERFKQKVEAGAEYAITQPVFDENSLLEFLAAVESFKIPVIAGIWPFTSYKNAEFMANEVPGVVVPDNLLRKMSQARTREEGRDLGIEIAWEMIEKISDQVAGFAISAPFGNVKIALAVLKKIDRKDL